MHSTNLGPTEPYQDLQDSGSMCEIPLLDPQLVHPSLATGALAVPPLSGSPDGWPSSLLCRAQSIAAVGPYAQKDLGSLA